MNNINQHVLSQLTQNQQIVYTAMMMDPKHIPLFNQAENAEYLNFGKTIKQMFNEGIFSKMVLNDSGVVMLS